MEASERTLISRYKEMRRVHPFATQGRISKGIEVERSRFAELRRHADVILDTTGLSVKELKEVLQKNMLSAVKKMFFRYCRFLRI